MTGERTVLPGCQGRCAALLLAGAAVSGSATAADTPAQLISQINAYRAAPGRCGGRAQAPGAPLSPQGALAAERIRTGTHLESALEQLGYDAERAEAILVTGAENLQEAMDTVRERHCATLLSADFSAIGVLRQGENWQIVLAQPIPPLSLADWPLAGREILALVNQARTAGHSCGERWYPPAPAIGWNDQLGEAALAHSQDMAAQRYFAHRAKDGSLVGERTLRTGYRWRTVGENIAVGQTTPAEAVSGWLSSPGHCANIMHPGFTEMGGAYAIRTDRRPKRVYWTQVFATP
jgi:hypothetical protein